MISTPAQYVESCWSNGTGMNLHWEITVRARVVVPVRVRVIVMVKVEVGVRVGVHA